MWERFSNLASVVTGQEEEAASSDPAAAGQVRNVDDPNDLQIEVMEQERLIIQLKEMIRERDKNLTDKDNELKKLSAEHTKHRLQSKSKIASLTSRLDQSQKSMSESLESASVCSDESTTSTLASEASSVIADQTSRARLLVLKKRLKEKDLRLAEKDAVIRQKQQEVDAKERIIAERESATQDVTAQLAEQTSLVEHLRSLIRETADGAELTTKKQLEVRMEEMISQMVHKDNRIMDLSRQMTEKDESIIDLQEHISEKDEVIRGRDQAIQVLKSMGGQERGSRDEGQLKEVNERLSAAQMEIERLKDELQRKETVAAQADTVAEVMKVMEQKLLEASDLISTKTKRAEQLELEVKEREQAFVETRETLTQTMKELESVKRNFAEEEEKWKVERLRLVDAKTSHEEESRQQRSTAEALSELRASYNSLSVEFQGLHDSHSAVLQDLEAAKREQEMDFVRTQEQLCLRDKQIEELRDKLDQAATTPDSKFAKFKALAGSKIKALEKQVEELKQNTGLAEELTSLRNHVAELEEEKGNLQLQLLEMEETHLKQAPDGEVVQLKREVEDLQVSYSALEEANKLLELTITELKTSIQEIKEEEIEHSFTAKKQMEAVTEELKLELEEANKIIQAKDDKCLSLDLKLKEVLLQEEQERAAAIDSLKSRHVSEIDDLSKQNAVLSSTLARLEKEIEDRNERLQKFESDSLSISILLKAEEQKVLDLNETIKEKDLEIRCLGESVKTFQEQLSNYKDMKQELQAKEQLIFDKDLEIRRMHDTVTDALEQLSRYRLREQDLLVEAKSTLDKSSQIQYLNDEIEKLREKLMTHERKEQQSISLERIAEDREQEIHRLTQMGLSTSDQLSNYEKREEQLILNERQMQAANESLKQSLILKDENILDLVTERESNLAEIQQLKSKVEFGKENEEQMRVTLTQLEQQIAETNVTISTLEMNFRAKDTELENVLVKLNSIEVSLERSSDEKEALQLEIDKKTEDMKKLLMELDEIQNYKKQADERLEILERSLLEKDEEVQKVSSDEDRFQFEIESLTSRLRESEDLVCTLEKKATDGERKVESLAQNLEEEEMQLVFVTDEMERLKTQLTEKQAAEEDLCKQLVQKDEELMHLSEALQEKELQAKKYVTLIKKMKQKQQSEDMLQKQSESFSSELQSCKEELEEKQAEAIRVQESLDEVQRQLDETVEELVRLRPVSAELKEMTLRSNNLAEEVRVFHQDKEQLERDLVTVKLEMDRKLSVLSSIQTEVQANCEEEILDRIATMQQERQQLHAEATDQKMQMELVKTELAHISGQREEFSQRILYLEKDLSVKSKELVVLGSCREELSLSLGQLELEKQNLVEELNSCQEILSSKDALIVSLNADLVQIQSELSTNISCTDLSSAEVESLRKQNSLLSETLSKLKEESVNNSATVEHLKAENFELMGRLETSGEELMKMDNEFQLSVGSGEEAELRLQLQDAENLNEELNHRLESMVAEKQALTTENSTMKNTLEQMRVEVDRERSHVADQDVELDALCHRIQMLTTEKANLMTDVETARSELAGLKLEHGELLTKNSHLESSNDHLAGNSQKIMDENCKLKLSCDSLTARLEELEVEKSEIESQLNRLTSSRSLEAKSLIKEKENQDDAIRELQLEIETLRGSARMKSSQDEILTQLEEAKHQCLVLDTKCNDLNIKLETTELENEVLLQKVTESSRRCELAESRSKDFELKLESSTKAFEDLRKTLEDEKMRLEVEAGKLKERTAKAEATVQQLLMDMEIKKHNFATVESELQGSVEELELQVGRLTHKVEILENRNEKHATDMEAKVNELTACLQTCLEEKRQLEMTVELDRQNWNQQAERFASDLEQALVGRGQLEEEMQRRMKESQEQYDMLADDINHYQDLTDQLKAKNSTLEQTLSDLTSIHTQEKLNLVKEAEQAAKEKHTMRQELDELSDLKTENLSLMEEVEKLSRHIQALTETDDTMEETQSRLYSLQSENDILQHKLEDHKKQLEDYKTMQAEQATLNERYEKLLQDNNALIHQSEEMYAQIRRFKNEEMEFLSLKERHEGQQNEQTALYEEVNRLRLELQRFEAENKGLRDSLFSEKQEKRRDHLKADGHHIATAVQSREDVFLTRTAALGHERQQQTAAAELDEDTPRIHVPVSTALHSDIKRSLSEREAECGILTSQVAELSTHRDQLLSHIQQREHELSTVHQQFQMLYQQYAILQQHYTAAVAKQNATSDLVTSTASVTTADAVDNRTTAVSGTKTPSCGDQDALNSASAALSKRLEDSERLCKEMSRENNRLEQHLESEREKRLQLEEMLGRVQEQLKLQELSTQDSHSITMVELEEERKIFRTKTGAAPRHLSRIQCPNIQRWFDGCSIVLGRVLRGQPQVRKALLLYIAALHVYVIFGCLLSML